MGSTKLNTGLLADKMWKLLFLTILLLGSSLASPLPQVEDAVDEATDSGSQAILSLFSQLAGVVTKTGDVISKLSENYTDVPVLTHAGEKISEAGENLPGEFNDIVQDNSRSSLSCCPASSTTSRRPWTTCLGSRRRFLRTLLSFLLVKPLRKMFKLSLMFSLNMMWFLTLKAHLKNMLTN